MEGAGRTVYAREGSNFFKVSAFLDHSHSGEYKRLAWATHSGGKTMEKEIHNGQHACDEAL